MYINMIKLKKYHLYKVFHKKEQAEYSMFYLGKSKTPLTKDGVEYYQLWGMGAGIGVGNLKMMRRAHYKYHKKVPSFDSDIHLTPYNRNNEHTIDVLEEIPLSSIKMPLWELKGTPENIAVGSANPYANSFKSAFVKPKKDYSKMRVINL